jgi:hypothetical protein
MAIDLFGFEIKRKKEKVNEVGSVVSPSHDDGSTVISGAAGAAAYYSTVVDLEGVIKNENDLIRRYREVAQYPDCDNAIEDIVNECIISDSDEDPVDIVLDDLKLSDGIKKKITEEFKNVIQLLNFDEKSHEIFRSWYIDGRLYYHVLIDEKNIKAGINELRFVDPRKIRKIKKINKKRNDKGVEVVANVEEYYLYNDKGINENTTQGVKLSTDSIIFCPSGLIDANTNMMMSHLHKAIKPVNQLKMVEDSLVIYRVSRAPERRIFYIDVGNLPKLKAEQYVNDIMNKYRNKIVYDAATGEIRDDRKHLSMMEDFWMPRREGGKGTEITTLAGGQNLGNIEDINYFQNKLYQALNVPITRLQPGQGFSIGRASEITRDEVKFNKFINRLRKKFSNVFLDALRIQLISKGIIRADEWDDLSRDIGFDFRKDNFVAEMKDNEVLQQRMQMLQNIDNYIGKYYSIDWVRKNVLHQTDEEIKEIDTQIEKDRERELNQASHEGQVNVAQQAPLNDYQAQQDQGDE